MAPSRQGKAGNDSFTGGVGTSKVQSGNKQITVGGGIKLPASSTRNRQTVSPLDLLPKGIFIIKLHISCYFKSRSTSISLLYITAVLPKFNSTSQYVIRHKVGSCGPTWRALVTWQSAGLSIKGTVVQSQIPPFRNLVLSNFVHPTFACVFRRRL